MSDCGKTLPDCREVTSKPVTQSGWEIGTLLGIPLRVDPSWFFIAVVATSLNALSLSPSWGWYWRGSIGLVVALCLFASVLLHELGHSLVARSQGIQVHSITLFIFGGMASLDRDSKTPEAAFQIAIAGPLVSLGLFGLFNLGTVWFPETSLISEITTRLALINLMLALFNLLPGLPLDGGQILKAIIWKILDNRFAGIRWAAVAGQILGWIAIAGGIALTAFTSEVFSGFWIALLGWFSIRNARIYQSVANLQESLLQLKAVDAMSSEYRVVDGRLSLRKFADDYLLQTTPLRGRTVTYFATAKGRYCGRIRAEDLRRVPLSEWETQTLQTLACPLTEIPSISETTPLVEAINLMETQNLQRLTVLSPAGAVAGMIDRGDIVRAVANYLHLPINELQIRRIKDEGSYPLGLQLGAIAKLTLEYK